MFQGPGEALAAIACLRQGKKRCRVRLSSPQTKKTSSAGLLEVLPFIGWGHASWDCRPVSCMEK